MSESKPIRMMIAGGGTGGHIFPAVAIGHAMRRMHPGSEILFVGAKGRMEMDRVPQEGFPIEGLDIAGFDRGNLLKNITLPWKLIKSFLQARSLIRRFRPDVAVGVGVGAKAIRFWAIQNMAPRPINTNKATRILMVRISAVRLRVPRRLRRRGE